MARLAAALLATLSFSLPASASAGAVQEPPAADSISEAKELYQQGLGRYETADYLGAIDLWTQAFTALPDSVEYATVKADLIYNLARARERQYDVDNDPGQLRQALILLDQYVESLPSLYADPAEVSEQRQRAGQVRQDIQARLDEHEKAEATRKVDGPAPAEEAKDPGRGLFLGGVVLTALGGASLGAAGAGMALGAQANDISDIDPSDIDDRRAQFDRGRTMNMVAIAGGVGAAVFIGTGVALMVVGKKKSKESKTVLAPVFTPGYAGLSASARF